MLEVATSVLQLCCELQHGSVAICIWVARSVLQFCCKLQRDATKLQLHFRWGLIFQGCGEGTTHAVRSFPDVFGTTFGRPLAVHMSTSMFARGVRHIPTGQLVFGRGDIRTVRGSMPRCVWHMFAPVFYPYLGNSRDTSRRVEPPPDDRCGSIIRPPT